MHQAKLSHAEKAVLGREIGRAQATLERARKMAATGGDWMLAKSLGEQVQRLGEHILQIHDSPKISISDLL